jgi:hypothetical protein
MINLEQRVSREKNREDMAEVVKIWTIYSINSSEVAEVVEEEEGDLEEVSISIMVVINNKESQCMKIFLKIQMSLSLTLVQCSNFTEDLKFGQFCFTTLPKRKAEPLKTNTLP